MAPGSRAAPKLRLERNDPAFAVADDNNGDRSRVLDKDNAPIADSKPAPFTPLSSFTSPDPLVA
jgi:hypothetical protein